MSSLQLQLVPTDPSFVPTTEIATKARSLLESFVSRASEVDYVDFYDIQFFDGGEFWEGVHCPFCGTDLETWWGSACQAAAKKNFSSLQVTTPCCQKQTSLNDLKFVSPAAFGRFVLQVEDWNHEDLTAAEVKKLETCLGCSLRRVVMVL